jgi:Tfp pilus assembly protein PilF
MPTAVPHRPRPSLAAPTESSIWRFRAPLAIVALAILPLIAFHGVFSAGFINFDDDQYLTANPFVLRGLTIAGVQWAFSHAFLDLYHPLSLVSLMADVSVFGVSPLAIHAENLLIHIASGILLFLIFKQATADFWRSALLAAIFSIHPLRVESVAWAAERKDVLAMFFGLLAVGGYLRFVRASCSPRIGQPIGRRAFYISAVYLFICACFVLSLLAKPMFVTLPAALLLLDFWPLRRISFDALRGGTGDAAPDQSSRPPAQIAATPTSNSVDKFNKPSVAAILVDKLPLLALAVGYYWLMRQFKPTLTRHADYIVQSPIARLANAAVSYVRYLIGLIFPIDLATPYPIVPHWPAWIVAGAVAILLGVTIFAGSQARRRPWLIVGWLWFLGTMLPSIGIVGQIAFQSMADRYSYLPSIGLIVMAVWSIPNPAQSSHRVPGTRPRSGAGGGETRAIAAGGTRPMPGAFWTRPIAIAAASVYLSILLILTMIQTSYWHDSIALFAHAAGVTSQNDFAEYSLANAYFAEAGDAKSAIAHYRAAIAIKPDSTAAHDNLGYVLIRTGDYAGAIDQFRRTIRIDPNCVEAYDNWGTALSAEGQPAAAAEHFEKSLKIDPDNHDARLNLALAQLSLSQFAQAAACAQQLVDENPADADAQYVLARAKSATGADAEALPHAEAACHFNPSSYDAHLLTAQLCQRLGKSDEAAFHYQFALRIRPSDPAASAGLRREMSRTHRNGEF